MSQALATSDLAKLAAASHTLKGSASNLGARRLAQLCASLEKQARAGQPQKAARTLAEVHNEFARVRELLNLELES